MKDKDGDKKETKQKFDKEVEKTAASPQKKTEAKKDGTETPKKDKENDKEKDLVAEEKVQTGQIKFSDIKDLMSFSYGMCGLFLFTLMSITATVLQLVPSIIISRFTMLTKEQ